MGYIYQITNLINNKKIGNIIIKGGMSNGYQDYFS